MGDSTDMRSRTITHEEADKQNIDLHLQFRGGFLKDSADILEK